MELIAVLTVLTVSIITNLMVFYALRSLRSNELELTTTLETTDPFPLVEEKPSLPVIPETPPPAAVVKEPKPVDESYYAWKNRTEQPISAPPSPHGPPPKPGPMQRPYGFSR